MDDPAGADTEKALCAIFAAFLERASVRPDDDFFALGGHSMLATRLVNRIKDEFRVELSLETMFENPTPAELAKQLGKARPARPLLQARRRPGGSPS